MKLTNFVCISIAIICLFSSKMVFAEDKAITYKNDHGSLLTLQFHSNKNLTGSFTNAVASKSCPQSVGMPRPIQGWIADNAITIIVNYPDCGAVVAFIGHMKNKNTIIDTTALVASNASNDSAGPLIMTHDVFKKI